MTRKALSASLLLPDLLFIAYAAGELIMRHYQGDRAATRKLDDSPVTEADRAADAYIVQRLAALAPDIAIVSEEGDKPDVAAADYFWLVDPLDGTKSFVRGSGYFTVNIGLIGPERSPIAGVIYDPVNKAMYYGAEGKAFRKLGEGAAMPIQVRKAKEGKLASIVSHSHLDPTTEEYLSTRKISERLPCASSIKFCRIAEGSADVYPRFGHTMEWDTAAGHAILLAAGGGMTTPEGAPFTYGKAGFENGGFIACGE